MGVTSVNSGNEAEREVICVRRIPKAQGLSGVQGVTSRLKVRVAAVLCVASTASQGRYYWPSAILIMAT